MLKPNDHIENLIENPNGKYFFAQVYILPNHTIKMITR